MDSEYQKNKEILIENYTRNILLGSDTAMAECFKYFINKSNETVITRIYTNSKAEKIIIPTGFDALIATLCRKRLKYLDLGSVYNFEGKLSWCPNLEVFKANSLIITGNYNKWVKLFQGATKLRRIEIDNLITVSMEMFIDCKNALEVVSCKSVDSIDVKTFKGCNKLKKISLSNKLITIYASAFMDCVNLEEIDFYGTKKEWERVNIAQGNEVLKFVKVNYLYNNEIKQKKEFGRSIMLDCSRCDFHIKNDGNNRRMYNIMMKPDKEYCIKEHKARLITAKAKGNYDYPIWCPFNDCKKTCLFCGSLIREEQLDICDSCKKKEN